jgi:hypothetical protein
LRQKAAAGWRPRKWTAIVAAVRDAFAPKPKPAHVKPWTSLDVTNVKEWLGAFMDAEEAPPKLVTWIIAIAAERSLSADDIHRALDAAWKRGAAPGQENAPRCWNWFYEVLRAAFIPGYAARLLEAPAAPRPEHRADSTALEAGMDALDGVSERLRRAHRTSTDSYGALIYSYTCRCGGEIRQYSDRVVGTCTCSSAKQSRQSRRYRRQGSGGLGEAGNDESPTPAAPGAPIARRPAKLHAHGREHAPLRKMRLCASRVAHAH